MEPEISWSGKCSFPGILDVVSCSWLLIGRGLSARALNCNGIARLASSLLAPGLGLAEAKVDGGDKVN